MPHSHIGYTWTESLGYRHNQSWYKREDVAACSRALHLSVFPAWGLGASSFAACVRLGGSGVSLAGMVS